MTTPDPDPEETPGLGPGGGVPPGETPPAEGSQAPGPVGAGPGRRTATPWVVVAVIVAIAVATVLFFAARLL